MIPNCDTGKRGTFHPLLLKSLERPNFHHDYTSGSVKFSWKPSRSGEAQSLEQSDKRLDGHGRIPGRVCCLSPPFDSVRFRSWYPVGARVSFPWSKKVEAWSCASTTPYAFMAWYIIMRGVCFYLFLYASKNTDLLTHTPVSNVGTLGSGVLFFSKRRCCNESGVPLPAAHTIPWEQLGYVYKIKTTI